MKLPHRTLSFCLCVHGEEHVALRTPMLCLYNAFFAKGFCDSFGHQSLSEMCMEVQCLLVKSSRTFFHEAAPHSKGAVNLIYQSGTKDIVESSLVYNRQ